MYKYTCTYTVHVPVLHVYCIHTHIVTHFTDNIILHYVAEDSLVVINRLAQEQKTVSY